MPRSRTDDPAAWALAALMVVSGVTHVTSPGYHRGLVPSWLPARSAVVAVSGLADVATGVLVAVPATRRAGARATAALITAHLPAHLEPLRHRRTAQRAFDRPVGVAARVAVNLGYVAWAAAVARRATGRPRTG
ncbi:DoxX family protein [Geodermatophilus sp. URMC 61]|uniref:DoxX family protein n=1 Tax=Geodermatophilus sp. URMC 61 TaxID=3423411 RepID=UPI00406CE4A4